TRMYGTWVLAQLVLLLALIAAIAAMGWTDWVWPGQQLNQIVLVTLLDWMLFFAMALKQLGDSKALTARPQIIGAGAAVLSVAGVLGLAGSGHLTFYTYAALNLVTAGATSAALAYWLLRVHRRRCWTGTMRAHARQRLRDWWAYARPLILVEYYTP